MGKEWAESYLMNEEISTHAIRTGAMYRTMNRIGVKSRDRMEPPLVIWLRNIPLGAIHPM